MKILSSESQCHCCASSSCRISSSFFRSPAVLSTLRLRISRTPMKTGLSPSITQAEGEIATWQPVKTYSCWITFSGPYRWFAEWQMQNFGSYELKITLFGPLIILMIPVGLLAGWGPLVAPRIPPPAVRAANARRNARTIALLGLGLAALGAIRRRT